MEAFVFDHVAGALPHIKCACLLVIRFPFLSVALGISTDASEMVGAYTR